MIRKRVRLNEYNWIVDDTQFRFRLWINDFEEILYTTDITTLDRKRINTVDKICRHNWTPEQRKIVVNRQRKWCKNNPERNKFLKYKNRAIRNGWGKPNPINKSFINSVLHHLHINNTCDCIYIPVELHKSWHSNKNKESMNKINDLAIEWYNEQYNLGLFKGDAL